MRIIYITFIDMDDISSGSSVRPHRMLEAFRNKAYDILLVSGRDMFHTGREERICSIKEALQKLKSEYFDYCYVENGTEPVKLSLNWKLLSSIYKKRIPIAYFYRDFYYKVYKERDNNIFRDVFLRYLYFRDERLIRRYVDVLYLPSSQCKSYFRHKNIKTLPPGIDYICSTEKKELNYNCVYVGGVNKKYGISMIVDAFELLNKKLNVRVGLSIVCRIADYEKLEEDIKKKIESADYIEVMHIEGKALYSVFSNSDIGLIPRMIEEYNNLAIPVKISDYLANGLPIISTPLEAEIEFFGKSNACIFSKDDSAEEFAKSIYEFYRNDYLRELCQKAVIPFVQKNTWASRVERIEEDLFNG